MPLKYIWICALFFAPTTFGILQFTVKGPFSTTEINLIKTAQSYWNRYTTHHACEMSVGERESKYTIFADEKRLTSPTYTLTRFVVREGVKEIRAIEIHINTIYMRRCPSVFLPFLLHEFGHALGLKHNNNPYSIMNITSVNPLCGRYIDLQGLPGIDIYYLYHQLGGQCQQQPVAPMQTFRTRNP